MDNPLPATADPIQRDAMVRAIAFQSAEHFLCQRIGERTLLRCGGNDVIHCGHGPVGTADGQTLIPQSRESLRAGDLMDQMETHKQLGGTAGKFRDAMEIPNLVVQGS